MLIPDPQERTRTLAAKAKVRPTTPRRCTHASVDGFVVQVYLIARCWMTTKQRCPKMRMYLEIVRRRAGGRGGLRNREIELFNNAKRTCRASSNIQQCTMIDLLLVVHHCRWLLVARRAKYVVEANRAVCIYSVVSSTIYAGMATAKRHILLCLSRVRCSSMRLNTQVHTFFRLQMVFLESDKLEAGGILSQLSTGSTCIACAGR